MWLENENNAKKTQQQTYNKSLSFIERYFLQGKIQETAKERLKDMELVKVNDELVPEVIILNLFSELIIIKNSKFEIQKYIYLFLFLLFIYTYIHLLIKHQQQQQQQKKVYLNAHDAYASLSTKLGNKKYFFGDKPSTLDAIAYGHLALHCYPNLQNPKLFSMFFIYYFI